MEVNTQRDIANPFVGMLKKVGQALKRGVVRGSQKYTINTALIVNCMGHSFFNLENSDLEEISKDYDDELRDFFWMFERFKMFQHHISSRQLCKKAERDLLDKMLLAGFNIEECNVGEQVDDGQFKVAYYFRFDAGIEDFHFIRQEKDGRWSSKAGASLNVEEFDHLPKKFNDYKLIKVFKVTNPYIFNKKEIIEGEKTNAEI